jgi:hypothetical protein
VLAGRLDSALSGVISYRAVRIDVAVIVVCAALVTAGVVLVVRWGAGAPERTSADAARRAPAPPFARLARQFAVMFAAGTAAGVLAAGAGGRLVMRLLAVTSPDAHGRITEADATIGDITVGGTISVLLFGGVIAGVLSALLYVLVGSLLPRGRAGGVTLGLLLLVLAGARFEPLRADNFDFNLLGPDWLSVLLFTGLAVFQGLLIWAVAGRLNLHPLPIGRRSGGSRAVTAGRVTTGVLVLVALPGFVSAVADILTYG